MSIIKGAKEFFGLAPMDDERDDAYYDEPRYADDGAAAYTPEPAPRYREHSYRPMPAARREYEPTIVAVEPRSYADATQIGEPFRDGDAVIFEVTTVDKAVAKRIVDFAAGLCFASRGAMHNLVRGLDTDRRVFALVPENADVTVDELQHSAGLIR